MSNNWHEHGGFPPLEEKCEALIYGDTVSAKWVEGKRVGEALAANMGSVALFSSGSRLHIIGSASHFRPIKSEREKTIEAVIACCTFYQSQNVGETYRSAFEQAYDNGFLKMPEVEIK
jgi:hypothetical protein